MREKLGGKLLIGQMAWWCWQLTNLEAIIYYLYDFKKCWGVYISYLLFNKFL